MSFVLLLVAIVLDYFVQPSWFTSWIRIAWYVVAYLPVGFPVVKEAVESIQFGAIFSEFFLMTIATIGAFGIGEYPEAVAVMLFYSVGVVDTTIALIDTEEIAGHGIKTTINGKELLVGNFKLLQKFAILFDTDPATIVYTTIAVAYDGQYVGYITIADTIKADAANTIQQLNQLGVNSVMLSGDKLSVVNHVASTLNILTAYGDLLPSDKVEKVRALKEIGKATKNIVWQNIGLAFGVKLIVLALGAGGIATMWEAVFADVGVALLAILNAVRIQRMSFH